ncbi:sugar phosphate isomerase/epimerase [Acidaminobacter sp. JC074]|uniref:sugar phosphate isomerase/epimerase family protein n=1 Tax=Acidaminobacter sp. JC074 TaxID=2530199 RepID=UPI001F1034EB|nr:sugar phosphate isomerase/epimerase family protein [Acidaminobacter sp. JC074]MCH4886236.1 sugar phosphate isomerase/epimerase [Acidaminobacter sp. JC074]
MNISTIIMNPERFDSEQFEANNIGIEIQTFPQDMLDDNYDDLIELWKSKLKNYNQTISLHGSSFDLNPGSTDKRVLEVTKFRYLQSVDIAEKLNADYVVFHSQVNPLLTVERIRKLKLKNQIDFWNELLEHNIPSDICVLLENEYDETYEDILEIIDGVNHDNIGVCLDIGHALAYSKVSLENWILNLGDKIKYIHVHWNDGTCDAHDKPSNEELKILADLLDKYNIEPVITLEYYLDNICDEINKVKENMIIQ